MVQGARGRLSEQIAHDICIAEATVKEHRNRAMQKSEGRFAPELGRMADKSSWCRHAATLLSCTLCATR
jgi:FixJ family two-component response regulator